jgi:hypothetical protein
VLIPIRHGIQSLQDVLKLKLYESARKETGMSMAWGVLDVDNLLALV